MKAFDLQEIKEQQEAAQVASELFSKITGDVAKAFEFEDGSKEKIVMHAPDGASVHACAITIYYSSGVGKIPRKDRNVGRNRMGEAH